MITFDFKQDFEIDDALLINFVHLNQQQREVVRTWRNSEKIRKWMYTDHIISQVEHKIFLRDLEDSNAAFYWLVRMWDNDIGVLYFPHVDFNNKNAYFGIYSNPDSRILGVGKKLDMLALKLVFECAGFQSLWLEVIEDNKISYLHKEMGFVEAGKLREFVQKDNTWKNVLVMGLVREEFLELYGDNNK
jgi:UDP-4-amino-4,6-dideoxy-N-acetyl-beta-L-altrosamine N-acetyltransferase